ncbi:MAG TPA: hypothetical protein VKK31_23150 [Thermoanaerobaculia bacterium]|nr:hypothetical protein [Thermoanaerobaculia bacterium]
MSPTQILRQAKKRLEALSEDRLRVADDFLAYLEERESNEATQELLQIPGFLDDFKRAEEEIRSGLLTPVEALKRKA